jgi:hypothetical protein
MAVLAPCSHAAFFSFSEWGASDVMYVGDNPGDQVGGAWRDITGLYYRHVGSEHFFRMDLTQAPSTDNEQNLEYMINIDDAAGGVSSSIYLYTGLSGIDRIVDSHYVWTASGHVVQHYHAADLGNPPSYFNGSVPGSLVAAGGDFRSTSNGGKSLEWLLPDYVLPQRAFDFWGSTLNIAGPHVDSDLSGPLHTPEPSTFALAAVVGLLFVAFRALRRNKA